MNKFKLAYIILRLLLLGSLCHAGGDGDQTPAQNTLNQDQVNLSSGFEKQYRTLANQTLSAPREKPAYDALNSCASSVRNTYHAGQKRLKDLSTSMDASAATAGAAAKAETGAAEQIGTLQHTSSTARDLSQAAVNDLDKLYGMTNGDGVPAEKDHGLCAKSCASNADGADADALKAIGQFRKLCEDERVALRREASASNDAMWQQSLAASTTTNSLSVDGPVAAEAAGKSQYCAEDMRDIYAPYGSATNPNSDACPLDEVVVTGHKFPTKTVLAVAAVGAVAAVALSSHGGSKTAASAATSSAGSAAPVATQAQMSQASTQVNADLKAQCADPAQANTPACKSYLNAQPSDGLGTLVGQPGAATQSILKTSAPSLRNLVNSGKLAAPGAPTP